MAIVLGKAAAWIRLPPQPPPAVIKVADPYVIPCALVQPVRRRRERYSRLG